MELFEKFLEYLKTETVIVENDNGVEFQLPFLGLRNDYICLSFDKKTQELRTEVDVNGNLLRCQKINSDNFGEMFLKLLQEIVVVNGLINFQRLKLPR